MKNWIGKKQDNNAIMATPPQLIEIYECECNPGTTYKTKQTFKNHFRSDRHQYWQCQEDNRHLLQKIVELENKNSSLKVERNMWKDAAMRLKRQHEPTDLLLD